MGGKELKAAEDAINDVVDWVDDAVKELGDTINWKEFTDYVNSGWTELTQKWLIVVIGDILAFFGITGKTVVDTQVVSNRILDNATPGITTNLLLSQKKEIDMKTGLNNMTLYGTQSKVHTLYDYAKASYVDGLPTMLVRANIANDSAVQAVLDTLEGQPTTILSSTLDIPSDNTYCDYRLQELYNMNVPDSIMSYLTKLYNVGTYTYVLATNSFDIQVYRDVTNYVVTTTTTVVTTTIIGTSTTVETTVDVVITLDDLAGNPEVYSTTQTVDTVVTTPGNADQTEDGTVVDVVATTPIATRVDETIINIEGDVLDTWYIVQYHLAINPPTEYKLFLYRKGVGVYPTLDYSGMSASNFELLPIITLKSDSVKANSDKNSERYKTTSRMCEMLGLDVDLMITNVSDTSSGEDVVSDAFIHFAVAMDTETYEGKRTIFNSVANMWVDKDDGTRSYSTATTYSKVQSGGITMWQDNTTMALTEEDNFNFRLVVGNLYYRYDTALATTNSIAVKENGYNQGYTFKYINRNVVEGVIAEVRGVTKTINLTDYSSGLLGHSLTVRFQVDSTTYVEYVVKNLSGITMVNRVNEVGSVTFSLATPSKFLLPVALSYFDDLSNDQKVALVNETLRVSVYALSVTQLAYYETKEFADFLKFVAVVVLVVTLGAAAIAGTLTATLINLAILTVAKLALEWVLTHSDNDWIQGVAAIAYVAIVIIVSVYGDTTVLMDVAAGLNAVSTVVNMFTEKEREELRKKAEAFDSAASRRLQELREAERTFELQQDELFKVANLATTKPLLSPKSFYELKLTTNIGAGAFSYDNAFDLGLPKKFLV